MSPRSPAIRRGRLPMLMMNGTADPLVPYKGGRGISHFAADGFWSAEKTLAFWRKLNGCESRRCRGDRSPDEGDRADHSTVTRITRAVPAGRDVVLYRINEGGHRMPGFAPDARFPRLANASSGHRTTTSTAPRRSGRSSRSFRERRMHRCDVAHACVPGWHSAGRCANRAAIPTGDHK